MKYPSENVFNLLNPQEYAYHVLSFSKRPHKHLVVAAYHLFAEEEHFFDFPGLEYIEGPPIWRGANFQVATKDELANLLPKIELDVEVFLDSCHLFIVEIPTGFKVKIIASDAYEIKDPARKSHWDSKSDVD